MLTRTPAEVFPPGEFINDELVEREWAQADLAEILGRPVQAVNEIVAGKKAITPETARGLGDAFGTGPELWVTPDEGAEYLTTQFSLAPDGSALVFVDSEPGKTSLWSLSEPGAEPELLLTRDSGLLGGPVFSPDARWVAYWSTKGSAARTSAIHVTPFPRTGDVYSTLEEDRFYPLWSADGKEVIYTTVSGDLFSRSVSTSGGFTFGPERPLSIKSLFLGGSRGFDILPDGERFLVIVPSETAPPRVNVVLNWFEELEERMLGP